MDKIGIVLDRIIPPGIVGRVDVKGWRSGDRDDDKGFGCVYSDPVWGARWPRSGTTSPFVRVEMGDADDDGGPPRD